MCPEYITSLPGQGLVVPTRTPGARPWPRPAGGPSAIRFLLSSFAVSGRLTGWLRGAGRGGPPQLLLSSALVASQVDSEAWLEGYA